MAVLDFVTVWTNANRLPTEAASDRALPSDDALCAEAPRLRRLVHRLLGWSASAHDIDDVVQDALLAAFRHREQFRGDAKLTTWLTRIALSKAKNHARSAKLRRSLFSFFMADDVVAQPEQAEPSNHEQLDCTKLAMRKLGHRDREVLVLRYLEQREVEQIAELLNCSRAAVDTRLTRARRRLRALLETGGTQ